MTTWTVLLDLPDEILLKIFKEDVININDVLNISDVCHRFENVCESEDLWKSKFIQRWSWAWKMLYSQKWSPSNWKKEACAGIELSEKFNEHLHRLSYELYKYQNITSPVLGTFKKLLGTEQYAHAYLCLNDLKEITQESNFRNLTKQYYSNLILQHLNKIICREDWDKFFRLPPSLQTLERASFYFAKWFQPKEFFNFEYSHMTAEFDSLANQTLDYLRLEFSHHPAHTHQLINPDEPLEESLWSETECKKIFQCMNHVLFTVNKYKGNEDYYQMTNSLINHVINTKKGIPVTLSIVYQAVCHRLGILLIPVNCPSHFMMKWRVTGTDQVEYVDAFHQGARTEVSRMSMGNHPNLSNRGSQGPVCTTRKVLDRMANNAIHVSQTQEKDSDICSAAEIASIFRPDDGECQTFVHSLHLSWEVNLDEIIVWCGKMLQQAPERNTSKRLQHMIMKAQQVLEEQKRGPKSILPKKRIKEDDVQFATGMVMLHKLYNYTCVIFGWDTVCTMPMEWIIQMNVPSLKYQHNQPFYNVLVADGSQRYAAQENLLHTEPVTVANKEVGKYFDAFNRHYYVPNEQLATEYPDEKLVRRKYYPNVHEEAAL